MNNHEHTSNLSQSAQTVSAENLHMPGAYKIYKDHRRSIDAIGHSLARGTVKSAVASNNSLGRSSPCNACPAPKSKQE